MAQAQQAQPYQDLSGNWLQEGVLMTPESIAQYQTTQAQIAQRVPVPGSAEEMLAMVTQDTQRRKRVGLNPIGAGLSFLLGK